MMRPAALPALLGGPAAFPQRLRFVAPTMPDWDAVMPRWREIASSGRWTNGGPFVQAFEQALAERCQAQHCVAVANATLGLLLAPSVWQLDGEVIVPSFTFSASVHTLVWNRLTPVFVDIDPERLTVDPAAVEAAVSPRTSAIVAVTLFGVPPDLDTLSAIASRHRLRLLCDSAQGLGSRYRGRPLGGFGDAEVFSFHAAKVLPVGEGGAVTTNDARTADALRLAINFGNPGSGDCQVAGLNAKLSEWAAALGLAGLPGLDREIAHRRSLLVAYRRRLGNVPGITVAQTGVADIEDNGQNVAILVDPDGYGLDRSALERVLNAEGIETKRYFDPPVHRMQAYARSAGRRMPLEHTERISQSILSLPLHRQMTVDDAERVSHVIETARLHAGRIAAQPTAGTR